MSGAVYVLWLAIGIVVALLIWRPRFNTDERAVLLPLAAIVGGMLGAKLAYLFAEGFLTVEISMRELLTGKSVLGGLVGGYLAVELVKRLLGFTEITGDLFAASVPIGIAIGRLGCMAHGCCLGIVWSGGGWFTILDSNGLSRWPAVQMEILFNITAALSLWIIRRRRILSGQHFHLYLISYGVFRFISEFLRDTPEAIGVISGYQVVAAVVLVFGVVAFIWRQRQLSSILRTA